MSAWAERLRISRFQLARECRALLGVTPRQACLDYVAAAAHAARAQGHRADAVADMLGYSDARALRRALQAAQVGRGSC